MNSTDFISFLKAAFSPKEKIAATSRENNNGNIFTDDFSGLFRSVGFLIFFHTVSLLRTNGLNPVEKQHAVKLVSYFRRKAEFACSPRFILAIASYPIIIFINSIIFNGPVDIILLCSITVSTLVFYFLFGWGQYFLEKIIENFSIYVPICTKFKSQFYLPFSFFPTPPARPPQR
ncbi:MAG: hypothetical protein PHV02_12770 [Rhodocyclaceae bacterium]|nr:hypothetical protein [Rhodocyclaceae bacterium]